MTASVNDRCEEACSPIPSKVEEGRSPVQTTNDQNIISIQNACRRFVRCIESAAYYEAHEALEALWFPRRFEGTDEVRLIRGYINASVAFELLERGRPVPAQRVWGTYLKYRPLLSRMPASTRETYQIVEKVLDAEYERLFRT